MTHAHLIGIGGTGLSAIALVLAERGYSVSGSDRAESPLSRSLRAAGIQVEIGHRAGQVQGADLVIRSSAIPDDNPEVQAARAAGIPVYKRADFLGELLAGQRVLAVAGTHGKTTTSAMLAWTLSRLGADPGFILGGVPKNLGANARAGRSGGLFVIEADEYDYMFLGLAPSAAVITNMEPDHPDCYPTAESYTAAFTAFVERLTPGGLLLTCADTPETAPLAEHARSLGRLAQTYGLAEAAGLRAVNVEPVAGSGCRFTVERGGAQVTDVALAVPGLHNVRNALAVLGVVDHLGLSPVAAAAALGEFSGAGRRFEVRGETGGATIIDDYGHHPTEIRATLAAARQRYPQARIWAVWQPHTYSRTRGLFADFAAAFGDADQVLVTEVYAAREPRQDFSSAEVVQAMPHPAARYVNRLDEALRVLRSELRSGDVVLVLSAGDADWISSQLLAGDAPGADDRPRAG